MKDFVLPFKPEELLAKPADGRLWAEDLPGVEDWSQEELAGHLDALIGKLLSSQGHAIADGEAFSLLFALLQAWPRLEENIRTRVVDVVVDAGRRINADVDELKKAAAAATEGGKAAAKKKEKEEKRLRDSRTASKVAAFFLRWCTERLLKSDAPDASSLGRGRGKGRGRGAKASADEDQQASAEELKEAVRALERQRCAAVSQLVDLLMKGAMPWLWAHDDASWQQVAQCSSDAGFAVLDVEQALKHRELRHLALRAIVVPLLQEGHQHSNLLVAAVSKLTHSLRGHELAASFAADTLLMAHTTPLPRSFLVELTQHCTPAELTSQGAFQRAMGAFLSAIAERLPHLMLANISILLPLLDVDCYPLRSAVVESIGHLLLAEGKPLPKGARCSVVGPPAKESGEDGAGAEGDGEAAAGGEGEAEAAAAAAVAAHVGGRFGINAATKKDLLDTLTQRSTDKTVWVRVRALTVLNNLAARKQGSVLPKEQWTQVLEVAIRRMQDVASSARKAAVQLVRTLIEQHPYGPALRGSGDERAKAEHVLREVGSRLKQLREEELQAEAAAAGVDVDVEVEDEAEAGEEGAAAAAEEAAPKEPAKKRRCTKKTVTDMTAVSEVDKCMEEGAEGFEAAAEKRKSQREALKRMQDCYTQRVQFVELIDAAESRLRALLVSRTATDVTEAINVVVELRLRELPAAEQAFNQVLGLVWSRTQSIKDAAVEAFYRMHLEGRDTQSAVNNLLEMYEAGCKGSWTYTHLASVQELIQQAAGQDFVKPKNAIPVLADALKVPGTCPMAMRALTALGAADWQTLAAQLPHLAKLIGSPAMGATASERLERVRLLCLLLQRLHSCVTTPLGEEAWAQLQQLLEHAIAVVIDHFAKGAVPPEWFGAAQAAMDLSFDLQGSATASSSSVLRCPDKLWEQILGRMLQGLVGGGAAASAAPIAGNGVSDALVPVSEVVEEEPEPLSEAAREAGNSAPKVTAAQLGCVVFLSGHLALRMLVFLEGLQSALKKKRLAEEDARMAEQREKKKEKKEQEKGKKKGKKGGKAPDEEKEEEDEEDQNASMGMAGQEEREAELFAEIAEQRLLYGSKNLLDRVKPLIFGGLLKPSLRASPVLRRLAAISLCKFMTVSKRFCEEHLQLLFSMLFPKASEHSPLAAASVDDAAAEAGGRSGSMATLLEDVTMRQSLLVAVGDLLFRHPNVVEPWSDRLYAALGAGTGKAGAASGAADGGVEMRLTALLVLTHLVLNDMMKPRAVLLVRALWLTACPHDATSRVARILFQELAKRTTNVVYNLLPEIVARLPELGAGIEAGPAEERVRYVMQFVEKEKHVEGLIEKFSVRLEQCADLAGGKASTKAAPSGSDEAATQAEEPVPPSKSKAMDSVRCLSTAIGTMNYSDRCILRLHDAVVVRKALNNALAYHQVARDNIMAIVERARKPVVGKAKGAADAAAAAAGDGDGAGDGAAAGGGGKGAAVQAALEALEQLVNKLGQGREKEAEPTLPVAEEAQGSAAAPAAASAPAAAAPAAGRGRATGARGAKRSAPEAAEAAAADAGDNAGFDEEEAAPKAARKAAKGAGRGRGGAKGGGRGRGSAKAAAAADDDCE